ncbi:MAG TPA: hypothetical protein VIV60_29325 [Polyangiaceae bacterium]
MYEINKTAYGFQLIFGDSMSAAEMQQWHDESKVLLTSATPGFGVFVDMRTLKPLTPDAQAIMQQGQKLFKSKGMVRSVVILASALVTLQFKRIAKETGIYDWERYIDASSVKDWQSKGIAWVRDKIDPDAAVAA